MSTATNIVHWPGKDTAACDEHSHKLERLGLFMGFTVTMTPIQDKVTPCANCVNEAKIREQR